MSGAKCVVGMLADFCWHIRPGWFLLHSCCFREWSVSLLRRMMVMQQQASLEVRSALEIWLTNGTRTFEQLEMLGRHWCDVYARDEQYTQLAIEEAKRLAARHMR